MHAQSWEEYCQENHREMITSIQLLQKLKTAKVTNISVSEPFENHIHSICLQLADGSTIYIHSSMDSGDADYLYCDCEPQHVISRTEPDPYLTLDKAMETEVRS